MPPQMSARARAVEQAMEAVVVARDARRRCRPLWESVVASGDWTLMAEAKELAAAYRSCEARARRIAGLAEQIECPDGIWTIGHGKAA